MGTHGANGTTVPVLSGRGLIHRNLDKRQLACIAADVIEHKTDIEWSIAQIMASLKVSRAYIDVARGLSPERRAAIINGRDQTSFVTLIKAANPQLPLWANGNGHDLDDAMLLALVRKVGPARMFDAVVAVDSAH